MAVTRTAKLTGTDTAGGASTTTSSISVASGATLVVGFGHRDADGAAQSVSWNGNALTSRSSSIGVAANSVEVWALENAPGGSGTIVITHNAGVPPSSVAYFATELTNVKAASFDQQHTGSGTSTSPSSGATSTLSQATEMAIGCIQTSGPSGDSAGSWSNSYSNGQRVGTSGASSEVTVSEGYLQTAATTAQTAAKTGITSRAWRAAVVTFMEVTSTTINGPAVDLTLGIVAGSVTPGAVSLPGATVDATLAIVAGTALGGARVVAGQVVEMGLVPSMVEAEGGVGLVVRAPINPVQDTILWPYVLGYAGNLGDGDLTTYASNQQGPGPTSGTVQVLQNLNADIPDRVEPISGVRIYALVRAALTDIVLGALPVVSNPRFNIAAVDQPVVEGTVATYNTTGAPGPFNLVATGLIAARPGGGPFTWAALNADFANTFFKLDWTGNFNDIVALHVAEMWISVFGPVGSAPDEVSVIQRMPTHRRSQIVRHVLEGEE